jgi:hypothetical protein
MKRGMKIRLRAGTRTWGKSERLNVKKNTILSVNSGEENPLMCGKLKVKENVKHK